MAREDIEIGSTYDSSGVDAAGDDLVFFAGRVRNASEVSGRAGLGFQGLSRGLAGVSIGARLAFGSMSQLGGVVGTIGNVLGIAVGAALDVVRAYASMATAARGAAGANRQVGVSSVFAAGWAAPLLLAVLTAAVTGALALASSTEKKHTGGRVGKTGMAYLERGEQVLPASVVDAAPAGGASIVVQVGYMSGDESSVNELVDTARRRLGGYYAFGGGL